MIDDILNAITEMENNYNKFKEETIKQHEETKKEIKSNIETATDKSNKEIKRVMSKYKDLKSSNSNRNLNEEAYNMNTKIIISAFISYLRYKYLYERLPDSDLQIEVDKFNQYEESKNRHGIMKFTYDDIGNRNLEFHVSAPYLYEYLSVDYSAYYFNI